MTASIISSALTPGHVGQFHQVKIKSNWCFYSYKQAPLSCQKAHLFAISFPSHHLKKAAGVSIIFCQLSISVKMFVLLFLQYVLLFYFPFYFQMKHSFAFEESA